MKIKNVLVMYLTQTYYIVNILRSLYTLVIVQRKTRGTRYCQLHMQSINNRYSNFHLKYNVFHSNMFKILPLLPIDVVLALKLNVILNSYTKSWILTFTEANFQKRANIFKILPLLPIDVVLTHDR